MSRIGRFAVAAMIVVMPCVVGLSEETVWSRVVVPVYTLDPIPGTNGSSWTTDLWALNGGDDTALVDYILWDCMLPECGNLPAPLEAGRTFRPRVTDEGSLRGLVLYVA